MSWPPSPGAVTASQNTPLDQQLFGTEAGRRIPARIHKRTTDIELPSPPASKPQTKGRPVRARVTAGRSR